jgi:hypothetical protein
VQQVEGGETLEVRRRLFFHTDSYTKLWK